MRLSRRARKLRTRRWWRLDPATGEWKLVYMETDYVMPRRGSVLSSTFGLELPRDDDVMTFEYEEA